MSAENRKFAYWVERDAIAIVNRSVQDSAYTYTSPTSVKTVTIFAVKKPNLLISASTGTSNTTVGYTEEPDIPDEFRNAVVAKAVQRGYELSVETLAAAQYWETQFEKGVREGKKYANTGYNEEPDIPNEFRHAIVAKAIQRGYELNVETLPAAQYWDNQYEKGVREGKRYANTGRIEKAVIKLQGFEPSTSATRDKDES